MFKQSPSRYVNESLYNNGIRSHGNDESRFTYVVIEFTACRLDVNIVLRKCPSGTDFRERVFMGQVSDM